METGPPVTPAAAVVRNLVRLIDCYLPLLPFLPGLLMVFLQRRNQRLGDLAAGTIVVRDHPTEWTLGAGQPAAAAEPIEAGPPELSDDEFRLLDQFLARQDQLNPRGQVRLATALARRPGPGPAPGGWTPACSSIWGGGWAPATPRCTAPGAAAGPH